MDAIQQSTRMWTFVFVSSLLITVLLGQKYPEEGNTEGLQVFKDQSSHYDNQNGQKSNEQETKPHKPQPNTVLTPSKQQQDKDKFERIMKPNLGVFNPSPQVKFPEPLDPPPSSFSSYGSDTKPSSMRYEETPPSSANPQHYYYYGKYQGSSIPYGSSYYNQIPHYLQSPYTYDNEGKHDQFVSYDHLNSEKNPFQHDITGSPSYYEKPYKDSSPTGTTSLFKDKMKTPWKTLVKTLTTLIPIGLFLAALPPNFVTINSTSQRRGKLSGRSAVEGEVDDLVDEEEEEENYPVLNLMGKFGISALDDSECDSRIFCEISRLGEKAEGNFVQKLFWKAVNDAPDMLTEMMGLKKLFRAARTGSCETYKCKDQKSR